MSNDMRKAFEQTHPLMGLVSWSDFDDCYTALNDDGLGLAEERTMQFNEWRDAVAWQSQQAQGEAQPLGYVMPRDLRHSSVHFPAKLYPNKDIASHVGGEEAVFVYLHPPAPAAVPSETILKAVEKKIRAADRTHHPIVRSTLIMEALEILDGYAAPAPAERGGQAGGEHE